MYLSSLMGMWICSIIFGNRRSGDEETPSVPLFRGKDGETPSVPLFRGKDGETPSVPLFRGKDGETPSVPLFRGKKCEASLGLPEGRRLMSDG